MSHTEASFAHVSALANVGAAFAQAGLDAEAHAIWHQAEGIITTIQDARWQARAGFVLTRGIAKARSWQTAERVARSIGRVPTQTAALHDLATALAKARRWQEAERLAQAIDDLPKQASALRVVAKRLAQAQQWLDAERIVRSIPDERHAAGAWSALAAKLTNAGQQAQAQPVWHAAERAASSIDAPSERSEARRDVATAFASAHCWQDAERVMRAIEDKWVRGMTVRLLVGSLARARHWQEAETLAAEKTYLQSTLMGDLATTLAKAHLWQEAERLTRSMSDDILRLQALLELAKALLQAGRRTEATGIWQRAEELATHCGDQEQAQMYLAASLAGAQQWKRAERATNALQHPVNREVAFYCLGLRLGQSSLMERAEWALSHIESTVMRAGVLRRIARHRANAHRWQEAERIAATIYPLSRDTWALAQQDIAIRFARAHQWDDAKRILRVVEADQDQRRPELTIE